LVFRGLGFAAAIFRVDNQRAVQVDSGLEIGQTDWCGGVCRVVEQAFVRCHQRLDRVRIRHTVETYFRLDLVGSRICLFHGLVLSFLWSFFVYPSDAPSIASGGPREAARTKRDLSMS